jgi:hypothetical protein
VDDHTHSAHISLTRRHKVVRRRQAKPFEAVKRGRSRPAEPAWLTNVLDQGRQGGEMVYLEAALDPASKLLCELTVDDRWTAVLSGHAADSIAEHHSVQLLVV